MVFSHPHIAQKEFHIHSAKALDLENPRSQVITACVVLTDERAALDGDDRKMGRHLSGVG